ncbi:MAG: hypothetical protein AAF211_09275 [Myxococcota bacterium]
MFSPHLSVRSLGERRCHAVAVFYTVCNRWDVSWRSWPRGPHEAWAQFCETGSFASEYARCPAPLYDRAWSRLAWDR